MDADGEQLLGNIGPSNTNQSFLVGNRKKLILEAWKSLVTLVNIERIIRILVGFF